MKWVKITIENMPRKDEKACIVYNASNNSKRYCIYSSKDEAYIIYSSDPHFKYIMRYIDILRNYSHYIKLRYKPRIIGK